MVTGAGGVFAGIEWRTFASASRASRHASNFEARSSDPVGVMSAYATRIDRSLVWAEAPAYRP